MTYTGDERRKMVLLDAEAKELIVEMHTLLSNKDFGLCTQVKKLGTDINGNGKPGLKTQVLILGIAILLLGADSPILAKIAKWVSK